MTHRATRWLIEDESKGERKVLQSTATIYPTRLAPKHHSRTDPEALKMVDSEALSWRIDQRGEMGLSLLTKLPFLAEEARRRRDFSSRAVGRKR